MCEVAYSERNVVHPPKYVLRPNMNAEKWVPEKTSALNMYNVGTGVIMKIKRGAIKLMRVYLMPLIQLGIY